MSFLVALSLSTGICCGIWALIASFTSLKLITWIGFAGCTAYFASGKHGFEGMKTAFFALMSGVASAFVAVLISSKFPTVGGVAILMTGIISGTMCYQSKLKELWFIPGAFLGCFSTFAYLSSGGDIMGPGIIPHLVSLLCGIVLAVSCDKGAGLLFKLFGKEEEQSN